MLLRSLELSAGATMGEPDALAEMHERARTHDREHLNIKPEYYQLWLNALIETAEEFDCQWSEDVETAWRRILGHVIEHMSNKY